MCHCTMFWCLLALLKRILSRQRLAPPSSCFPLVWLQRASICRGCGSAAQFIVQMVEANGTWAVLAYYPAAPNGAPAPFDPGSLLVPCPLSRSMWRVWGPLIGQHRPGDKGKEKLRQELLPETLQLRALGLWESWGPHKQPSE